MKHFASKPLSGLLALALVASLGGCDDVMSTSSTYEDAKAAFDDGQYRIANAHLAYVLANGEVDDQVRKLQLDLMLMLGDGNRAIAALDQLSPDALSEQERRIARAHAHVLQGSPDKAVSLYDDLPQEAYSEQDYRMVLWALREMGEDEDFAAGMDYALDAFPQSPHLNALAADQLYDFRLPGEAEKFANTAFQNGPDVLEARMVAGRKAIFEGNLKAAIDHYKRANEINPADPLPITNVVGLYLDLGNLDAAGEALKPALENHGDFPFLQWQVARYKLATGDAQGAREAKDRIERVFADNPEFLLLMGDIEAAFGNNRLALDNYRRFIDKAGEVPAVMEKIAKLEGQA
ncbi:tetratricopeptide repeat protein [Erythrobacter sp. SCSIO 43205]|uniref:tetratricopeptide repeat protein n=1 Tax=Erythrobacter sp. SCSIO 43205 TaxID=2779361 RepID=UPI001CA86D5A|nr:tetratricopeptide repeat protein [Erythrobacter sp. SCSIO 43205]UAB77333.1 tetratricopeptide repeat protein [Erythrobacter sp. SCSIO 43205]